MLRVSLTSGLMGLLLAITACKDSKPEKSAGCGFGSSRCNVLQSEADELRALREQAIRDNDYRDALRYTVDYNHKLELLEEYRNSDGNNKSAQQINAEYARIKSILDQDLASLQEESKFTDRQAAIDACKEPEQENSETCTAVRDTQSRIKQLEDLYVQESEANEVNPSALAATELEIKYLYLRLFHVSSNSHDAAKGLQKDYEKLWEIFQQINFIKKPNGTLPGMTCPPEHETRCRELEEDLVRLRAERKENLENQDPNSLANARKIDLEINYKQELLDLFRGDEPVDSAKVHDVEQNYQRLVELSNQHGLRPYSELEAKAVTQVFQEFGELYIAESKKDENGRYVPEEVKAKIGMPWSGYWYPKRKDDLFGGPESPLAKLDLVSTKVAGDHDLNSAAWELSRFSPDDADWAGLCDAWALASVQTPEPKTKLRFWDVIFTVSDQKALLIKKYEGYQAKIYGNRYYGSHATDGEIQDLRPEAFHRIIEEAIGAKKQAIVIDEDPGPEVWSRPMYRARWIVQKDENVKNAYVVKAWPYLVKNRVSVDEALTNPADMKAPVYEYRLYVDPKNKRDGKAEVIYGEWIGASLNEHPDIVFLPHDDALGINPINPEIKKGLGLIDRIFKEGVPVP